MSVSEAPLRVATGAEELAAVAAASDEVRVDERGELHVEGCSVRALVEAFGSPLYVVAEATLRANFRRIAAAYRAAWPAPVEILYAIKANNNLAIRAILHEEGAGGDVFGEGELYATFAGGADPEKVVLNGSNKEFDLVRKAVRLGLRINVDADDEVDYLARIAAEDGLTPRANIRLNVVPEEFDPTGSIRGRQWGYSIDGAERLIRALRETPGVVLEGYHLHIGRTSAHPDFHRAWARRLGEAIVTLYQRTGFAPRLLDAGGGYARERDVEARAAYALKPDADGDEVYRNEHDVAEYARAASEGLLGPLGEAGIEPPTLWVEPGRYICGNAVVLLTRVGAVKHDAGRTWVNVDASINNVPRSESHGYRYVIVPATRMHESYAWRANVVGPLCTGAPLGQQRLLPELARGDVLAILDAGMYAETMSTQMNGVPRPATVLVHDGEVELIKERESVADVFAHHRIPERLRAAEARRLRNPTREGNGKNG